MNGAEILIEALKREGVDTIFGISGGAALPIYDALGVAEGIDNILTRHEQGAAHMAEGYAKVSGKPGVCLATSGPGATNLVTGIADAMLDSVPIVAITGQVPTHVIGTDAFQESDIIGITMPIVKHSIQIRDASTIAYNVKKAFHIAKTGRPGPVLIDIPRDISQLPVEQPDFPNEIEIIGYEPYTKPDADACRRAAELINAANKPVLYVGGGVVAADAHNELLKLAEKADIPVVNTLMGCGSIPHQHRLSLNMLGMHGTASANWAARDADLLIAVGVRFDDRVTGNLKKFATNAKIIHFEIDPAEVHKNRYADVAVLGNSRETLQKTTVLVNKRTNPQWVGETARWREEHPLSFSNDGDLIKPQQVMLKLGEVTNGEDILATDVGQHQMWAAQYYPFKYHRQWLTSGGLGTMGYGFPAAIGAKKAAPDRNVWLVTGDGSFQMCLQELATASIYNLPVKIALINNGTLGMVRQWQTMFYEERYSGIDLKTVPDFVKLADAYGCVGIRVEKPNEVKDAIEQAQSIDDKTVLIDFKCDPNEHVFPMIASGASVAEMKLQPKND